MIMRLFLLLIITPYAVLALVIDQGSSGGGGGAWFEACNKTVTCGSTIGPLGFPFWGGSRPKQCGYPHLGIRCESGVAFLETAGMQFRVQEADPVLHRLTLTREDFERDGMCLSTYRNTTVDTSLLRYETGTKNLTLLYGCQNPNTSQFPGQFQCNKTGVGYFQEGVAVNPRLLGCNNSVVVPIQMDLEPLLLRRVGLRNTILRGFRVKYNLMTGDEELCRGCSGSCGYNETDHKSVCFRPVGVAESRKWYRKFIVPVIVVWCIAVTMVIVMLVLHYYGIAIGLW